MPPPAALERRRVDSSGLLAPWCAAVAESAVDLAAAQLLGDAARISLGAPQLVGQPEAGLEEAVIDAAQLAHQRAQAPVVSRRAKPVMLAIMLDSV